MDLQANLAAAVTLGLLPKSAPNPFFRIDPEALERELAKSDMRESDRVQLRDALYEFSIVAKLPQSLGAAALRGIAVGLQLAPATLAFGDIRFRIDEAALDAALAATELCMDDRTVLKNAYRERGKLGN
jgi:hypothetical protein